MDIALEVPAADQLGRGLERAASAAGDLTDTNREAGALVVLGATIPRVTGFLEASVEVHATDAGVTVTAGAPYAVYVHARDPFLTDALTARESAVLDLYTDHLDELVDDIKGS